MIKRLALVGALWCGLGVAQTATFPAVVAGNNQLMVGGNNLTTTLTTAIGVPDTSIPVLSTTGFQANMLITFSDSLEIAVVCSVSGPTLLIIGYGTCPSLSGRGFDNTIATTHASGTYISDWYTAWHHNALRVEIQAIETALGANLSHVITGVAFPVELVGGLAGCPTCVRSPSALALNGVMIGGGAQVSSTIAPDTNTHHALYATAGAPAMRATAAADLPGSGVTTINGTACTIGAACTLGTGTTCAVTSPSTVCTHNLNTSYPAVSCYDGGGTYVAAQGAATSPNAFLVTSDAALTCRFQ